MSNTDPTQLASLLCSRLCHDMLSPVGALSNGLELLAEEKDPSMREHCLELLDQSARISAEKLKFFRLAFGAAGGFGDMVPIDEPRALIAALVADNGRITENWNVSATSLPKGAVKILLNFAQIGVDSLVRGGQLDIGLELRGSACEIALRAASNKIIFDPVIGRALTGELAEGELTSRTAAAHMIHLIARGSGGQLQYALENDALILGANLPAA